MNKSIVNIIKEEINNLFDSQYLNLQRCQAGEINDVWDFRIVNGQHGEGIYAFLAGDKAMENYYCNNGENLHSFKIEKKYVADWSKIPHTNKLDYWDIKKFIYDNPQYKAFIFKHEGHGIPTSKEVLITDPNIIILNNSNDINEEYNHVNYLKWKRENVTIRGIQELGKENNGMASFGQGLYTAALGNREMARKYGKVYFVVGAIPKHPKIVNTWNDAEIFIQHVVMRYGKEKGIDDYFDAKRDFDSKTNVKDEMLRLGYDGLVIRGREMVNYTPDNDNIRYFNNENELMNYYEYIITNE